MRQFISSDKLPYSIRVLLESAVRNCDDFHVTQEDVRKILDWEKNQTVADDVEVPFKPARVILQVGRYLGNIKIVYFATSAKK